MKKILLLIGFILATMICVGQVTQKSNHVYDNVNSRAYYIPNPDTVPLENITVGANDDNNGWATLGSACVGCASYHYKVFKTTRPYEAEDLNFYYYYYFYFYSNSFRSDASPAGTYLSHIHFYVDGNLALDIEYILINPGKIVYAAWIRTLTPQSIVSFQPTNVTVY